MRCKNVLFLLVCIVLGMSCSQKTENQNEPDQTQTNKASNTLKVLFVLTSHDQLGNTGEKTGFWLEEFATPYYYLKDRGVNITIASPKGGQPPVDPRSTLPKNQAAATQRFENDTIAQKQLAHSLKLSEIKDVDYDAVFFPGGHGPLWDLAEDQNSIQLIESFIKNEKAVAAVCHGPAVFKHTKNEDGSFLVKDKNLTGFSDSEEQANNLSKVVPFLVEDMLIENGANYSKSTDWSAYAIEDGWFITGQNPASSERVAELLYNKLK